MDANLVFPNNALTRDWADKAVKQRWLARVDVVSVDPDSTTVTTSTACMCITVKSLVESGMQQR